MKRKPLSKVAIPAVSPKKQLRNSRSQENKETRPSLTLQADLNKEQQSKDECSIGKDMSREVAEGDLDKQPVEKSEGERSGVSLNSSFVTISTANSSSSQESFDRVSEDRLSSSQSSKEAFLFDKSSDGQLDYNDTFTSGEKTPNSSILSPGNQTVKNTADSVQDVDPSIASDKEITEVENVKTNSVTNNEHRDINNNLDDEIRHNNLSDHEIMSSSYKPPLFSPIPVRVTKNPWSLSPSECNRTNSYIDGIDKSRSIEKNNRSVADNGASDQEIMSQDYQSKRLPAGDTEVQEIMSQDYQPKRLPAGDTEVQQIMSQDYQSKRLPAGDTEVQQIMSQDYQPKRLPAGDTEVQQIMSQDYQSKRLPAGDTEVQQIMSQDYQPKRLPAGDTDIQQIMSQDYQPKRLPAGDTEVQQIMSQDYQPKRLPAGDTEVQQIMSQDYQPKRLPTGSTEVQEIMSQDYQLERLTVESTEDPIEDNITKQKQSLIQKRRQMGTEAERVLQKSPLIGSQTAFTAVMPNDLEPRQLMQVRQEGHCPLSPISEENLAVERVAKELVKTYGGKNSVRIPEILHREAGVSDYGYNNFSSSLPYQPPRDPRQPSQAQYMDREPHSNPGQLMNPVPFGDPQASSTPEIYQRKPICFSPDDFPSPYSNFDSSLPNQSWTGYPNGFPQTPRQSDLFLLQNSRQSDYFSENPLHTPNISQTAQQRSGYKGKGIVDLQGGGDHRPAPSHEITTMTFTPRAQMESHLSGSYYSNNSLNAAHPKESSSVSAFSNHPIHHGTNMDCSSIYPSREFIEKNSGGSYQSMAPARTSSYDTLVPPQKKRKLKSFSETDLNDDEPLPGGYHFGLPLIAPNFPQQRKKYYVVNPSDAVTMPSKTLISKYIDFLILENEQITEISKSVSQPVDIYVTEDMYFMDTLKVKVPFPSKKFKEWVRSFYPKLRVENMRFKRMGRESGEQTGSDNRPTQQVLEDIFYFFQREAMTLEGEDSFSRGHD